MIYTVKNNKLLIMFRTSLTSSYCSGKISPDSSDIIPLLRVLPDCHSTFTIPIIVVNSINLPVSGPSKVVI